MFFFATQQIYKAADSVGKSVIALAVALLVSGCGMLGLGEAPTATIPPLSPTSPVVAPVAQSTADTPAAVTTTPSPALSPAPSGNLLSEVKRQETLRCGVNADLPGFGHYDSVREIWSGFDVDFCRVVAAAVMGNAEQVEFVPLQAGERWEAIRSGEVDVLFRNSTWTAGRDTAEGVDFGPTTFHDGQGFMVRQAANITDVAGLEGRTVCVTGSTTSEANLRDEMPARGITIEIEPFATNDEAYAAYDAGQCDAITSDRSQLIAMRQTLAVPAEHAVLGELISREPLGPAFVENDSEWRDVISWAVFATIYAEELRVNQENVAMLRDTTTDPRIRRLLGLEGSIGQDLGLPDDFGYRIVEQVGNYGDIYNRNLGPDTIFNLDRGPNKAWNLGQGGVLSSPPFR